MSDGGYNELLERFSRSRSAIERMFGNEALDRVVPHRGVRMTLRDAIRVERDFIFLGSGYIEVGADGIGRRLDPTKIISVTREARGR